MYNETHRQAALLGHVHRREPDVLPAALPRPRRHAAPLRRLSGCLRGLEPWSRRSAPTFRRVGMLIFLFGMALRLHAQGSARPDNPWGRRDDAGMDAVLAAAVPPVRGAAAHQVSSRSGRPLIRAAVGDPRRSSRGLDSHVASASEQARRCSRLTRRPRVDRTPSLAGDVGDYFALLKPRVMSLVVFTALVGLVVAPGHMHPVIGVHRAALHRGRRGRGRRAQHVVRRRHRRDDDAHRASVRSRRAASQPGEALAFGLMLAVFSVVDARPARELARGRAARLHDLLLRRRLHDVAEALDAAEHRHRRRRRRIPADDRLGREDRSASSSSRCCSSSSSSSGRRRISGRWRSRARRNTPAPACRCCRSSRARRVTRRQILLYTCCWRRSASRRGCSAAPACSMASLSIVGGAVMLCLAVARLAAAARRERSHAAGKRLFGFSILYLFVLFAALLVEQGLRACSVSTLRADMQHDRTAPRSRHRAHRGAEAPPPRALDRDRAGARRARRCCSTSSRWSKGPAS